MRRRLPAGEMPARYHRALSEHHRFRMPFAVVLRHLAVGLAPVVLMGCAGLSQGGPAPLLNFQPESMRKLFALGEERALAGTAFARPN